MFYKVFSNDQFQAAIDELMNCSYSIRDSLLFDQEFMLPDVNVRPRHVIAALARNCDYDQSHPINYHVVLDIHDKLIQYRTSGGIRFGWLETRGNEYPNHRTYTFFVINKHFNPNSSLYASLASAKWTEITVDEFQKYIHRSLTLTISSNFEHVIEESKIVPAECISDF